MNNLRILLYMMLLSLAACHPEGTSVKQGLDKAAQLMAQDPDTASIILETIQSSQMNEAQLAEYNLLCTQLNKSGRRHLIMRNTVMNIKNLKYIIISLV